MDYKKMNAENKAKLRRGAITHHKLGLPIVKQKVKHKTSFSEELRNKQGYSQYLKKKCFKP